MNAMFKLVIVMFSVVFLVGCMNPQQLQQLMLKNNNITSHYNSSNYNAPVVAQTSSNPALDKCISKMQYAIGNLKQELEQHCYPSESFKQSIIEDGQNLIRMQCEDDLSSVKHPQQIAQATSNINRKMNSFAKDIKQCVVMKEKEKGASDAQAQQKAELLSTMLNYSQSAEGQRMTKIRNQCKYRCTGLPGENHAGGQYQMCVDKCVNAYR